MVPKKQLQFLDDWTHVRREHGIELDQHGSALVFGSVEEAFRYLRSRTESINVLVTGSLHLVGAVYEYINV